MSLEVHNISKTFYSMRRGNIEALKSVNLEVGDGTFFVLLGPSGCGKSTLLNIIAGIEKNNEGEIYIGERIVASAEKNIYLSPRERDIAMVFQSYALYPHMTVRDNISFPLKIARIDKDEINKRVNETLQTLEIESMADAKPAELSGGQRQRVALGRAIVRKPSLLLLDEPLSNLDALLRISMRSELKRIQRKLGVTTVYVTHDQLEAMSLGDIIAVLKEGRVQQIGTPDEIYNHPENLFVAKFVGTPPMNLLEKGILNKIRSEFNIENPDEFILGIRAEDIQIVARDKGLFNGRIDLVGKKGSENLLHIRVNDHKIIAKNQLKDNKIKISEGDYAGILFRKDDIFLFNRENGKRIN